MNSYKILRMLSGFQKKVNFAPNKKTKFINND